MKEGFYICNQCERCAFHKERYRSADVCVYFRELTELQPEMNFDTTYKEWEKKIKDQWDRECPYHIDIEESLEILRQYIDSGRM